MCGRLTSSTVAPAASSAATASRIARLDARLHAREEVLLRQPEPPAAQPRGGLVVGGRQPDQVVGDVDRRRGRVARVPAGDRVQQRRGVAGVAGERPDLVEAAREGHDPVPADAAVGRLQARRRRTGPPAGGSSRRCRCRCPAARGRPRRPPRSRRDEPPGTRSRSHGLAVGPNARVLGRRAHRELVHVGLAQDHGAGVVQPLGDVGVERRAVALEDPRAGGRLAARDRDEVLERDRDPEQRVERVDRRRTVGPRGRQPGIGGVGLGQRPLVVEREPGVEAVVGRVRPREVRRGDLARRGLARAQARRRGRGRSAA